MSDHVAMNHKLETNSPQLHALVFAAYVDDETLEALREDGPAMFLNVLPIALDRIIPRVPEGAEEDEWHTDFWIAMEDIASLRLGIKDGEM